MKDKIGLITFVSNNYGTCLQAFAMRKALESLVGSRLQFIHYERNLNEMPHNTILKRVIAAFKRYSLSELFYFKKYKSITISRDRKFRLFKDYIYSGAQTYNSIDELYEINSRFSAVVCGSDMIWSPEYPQYLGVFLLTWCGGARRVSYAPSFGCTQVSKELQDQYAQALNQFYRISCRESSGAQFVERIIGKKVPVVLDPTLLFNKNQWAEWFPLKSHIQSPYILIYCFGGISGSMRQHLEKISQKKNMGIRFILSPNLSDTVHEYINNDDLAYGPAEFVQLFANASFTVVNGYHGLIFSLIFEKPFVLLHRDMQEHWGQHEQRMSDLLGQLGLDDRYIAPDSTIDDSFYALEYNDVRDKIKKECESSWNYLKEALQ